MDTDKVVRELAGRITEAVIDAYDDGFPGDYALLLTEQLAPMRALVEVCDSFDARQMAVFGESHWIGKFGRKLRDALAQLEAAGKERI